jgi:hypothetical protein
LSVQPDILELELEGVLKLEEVYMVHRRSPQKLPSSFFSELSPVLSPAETPSSALVAKVVEAEDPRVPSQAPEKNPFSYFADLEGPA